MPVIRNLSSAPLFVPLNSGEAIRLSPGGVSSRIPAVELNGNAKIEKLVGQRVIVVAEEKGGESSGADMGAVEAAADRVRADAAAVPRSRPRRKG